MPKKSHFDAIYATAGPYSSLRVATALKRASNLPVVADLRNPFSSNRMITWPTRYHKHFYKIYERKLLSRMDRVVVVNNEMKQAVSEGLPSGHPPPIVIRMVMILLILRASRFILPPTGLL